MAGVELVAIADPRAEAATTARGVPVVPDSGSLPEIDFAVVSTPTASHAEVAGALIERGVHAPEEKPMAPSVAEAQAMAELADSHKVKLAVGHIERFNAAFAVLKRLVSAPVLASFERLSPFDPRVADSVVLDLMVHDLDLAMWIVGEYPSHVHAAGSIALSQSIDAASAVLRFPSGAVASVQASRVTQDKVRRAEVSEVDRFIVADSIRQDVLIKEEDVRRFRRERH